MRPLKSINPQKLTSIRALCFDSDGVLVKKGTKINLKGGKLLLETYLPSKTVLKQLAHLSRRYQIIIASGRSLLYLRRLYEDLLWQKITLLAENGLFALWQGEVYQLYHYKKEELALLKKLKQELARLKQHQPNLIAFEPKQFLITLHAKKYLPEVCSLVKNFSFPKELSCLWNGEAFDINFRLINKAFGLSKILQFTSLAPSQVLTVGNDPNDFELGHLGGLSITTDPQHNAQAQYFSQAPLERGGSEILSWLIEQID